MRELFRVELAVSTKMPQKCARLNTSLLLLAGTVWFFRNLCLAMLEFPRRPDYQASPNPEPLNGADTRNYSCLFACEFTRVSYRQKNSIISSLTSGWCGSSLAPGGPPVDSRCYFCGACSVRSWRFGVTRRSKPASVSHRAGARTTAVGARVSIDGPGETRTAMEKWSQCAEFIQA